MAGEPSIEFTGYAGEIKDFQDSSILNVSVHPGYTDKNTNQWVDKEPQFYGVRPLSNQAKDALNQVRQLKSQPNSSSISKDSSSRNRDSSNRNSSISSLRTRGANPRTNTEMGRSNPSQHVKDLVDARDQYRCVRCGKPFHWSGFSRHHRRLRSHKWPGLHEASNLILACGSGDTGCHGWIHAHPREAMSLGYIVSGFNDHPELVPILTAQHGWVLLDDKGGWTRCEPPKQ